MVKPCNWMSTLMTLMYSTVPGSSGFVCKAIQSGSNNPASTAYLRGWQLPGQRLWPKELWFFKRLAHGFKKNNCRIYPYHGKSTDEIIWNNLIYWFLQLQMYITALPVQSGHTRSHCPSKPPPRLLAKLIRHRCPSIPCIRARSMGN